MTPDAVDFRKNLSRSPKQYSNKLSYAHVRTENPTIENRKGSERQAE
jgi:hypothetical protein